MGLPEEIGSLSGEKLVVHVVAAGCCERWVLGEHDEKDNSASEQVNDLTLVWSLVKNFFGTSYIL